MTDASIETDRQNAITPTEHVIAEMLCENTGSHMLDSGIYGRAWQATRAEYGLDSGLPNSSWDGSPRATHDPEEDELTRVARAMRDGPEGSIDDMGNVFVDTFHWLTARIDYDEKLDRKWLMFDRVINFGKDRYDKTSWMQSAERFLEALGKRGASGGIYPGEGDISNGWTNTYNGECELDRTLQFALFHVEQDGFLPQGSYVLLQIHGGADVRGGYTKPRLFTVIGEQADMFDYGRLEIWCAGKEEDLVPDDQIDGQVTIEGEILHPVHVVHAHRWDNSYGDSHLRLTYKLDGAGDPEWLDYYSPDKTEHVLCLPWREEDKPDTDTIEIGYYSKEQAVPDVAEYNDEIKAWQCPFDESELRASGAMVG